MDWTAAVDAGSWLADRIDDPWRGTMHDAVPRGFDAYARVLHPVTRVRPGGRDEVEAISWARTATTFGTTMHPLAQWHALVAPGSGGRESEPRDRQGWFYPQPEEGQLDPVSLATVAGHLARHTTTPDGGHVAVWEGWGGLVGAVAPLPSRSFVTAADDGRHRALLSHLAPERFRSPFAKDRWQPGILPDDVSRGPRLRLPGRDHVLFTGAVAELASPDWVLTAPWRDLAAEVHGYGPTAHSPSLVWPDDRAWVLVSEVDWTSTVVAGTEALVADLCADPALEAVPLPADASLADDADRINV